MDDISKLVETPPVQSKKKLASKVKPVKLANEESSISLATKIYLTKPEHPEIKTYCENLWKKFNEKPGPRSLISLASTIKLEHSHAPCRKYLETRIGKKLNNFFFTKEKNLPSESFKTKQNFKTHFLLLLAHDPESARIGNLEHLLKNNPEIYRGNFYKSATPHQNVIMRSLFCNSIGKTLVKKGGNKKTYSNPETYIGNCYVKETKRAFLLARVKKDFE
ncbi:MAG: hypothetical protein ACQ9MH_05645 [Nitrospinales bacterium]